MNRRTGFAIAAALCALVLIAAVITGAFFASLQETSATRLEILDQQAFSVAELGLSRAMASWNDAIMTSVAQGSTTALGTFSSYPLEATVTATKLDSGLFVIVSQGRVTLPDAGAIHRGVSLLVRGEHADSSGVVLHRLREYAWSEAN